MAKHWSATSLVALALLGCLVWTEVEAQESTWQKPAPYQMSKGSPPQVPQVLPPRPPPQAPQYPQGPQVLPLPIAPQYPQGPQVLPPPKAPQYPQAPQVLPPPKAPQYPQAPQVLPPRPPPKAPQYPQGPQVLTPPKAPQYPQGPQVLPPPKAPQYPQAPQVLPPRPPPKAPQYPQAPQVLPARPPPKAPQYPQAPQVLPPRPPPKAPQYPQAPQVLPPRPPPKAPQYPQAPQVLPPRPPPKAPQYPQAPQVLPPRPPPKAPQYPQVFHDQEQHVPQKKHPGVPQTSSIHKPSGANQPPVQNCEVAANVRIPCGRPDISADGCDAINCCFDGRQCYFGKAVTVQVTKDAHFIVVVAKDATLPNIDLESISLLGEGQGCTHVDSNSHFAIYQFPVTSCGSVVMEEPGVIIYENRMSSSYEVGVGPLGAITRDSNFELLFQGRYIGTSVETVVVEVLPLQDPPLPVAAVGPIRVALRLANGQCYTKGCNELDGAYSSFYTEADYPVPKVLRDPVYVEVQLLEKTDPMLVLTLGRCWTTTSPNPHSLPQWDILIDGCPYRDDRYLSSLVPVGPSSGLDLPGHYRRFLFKMFTFVETSSLTPMKEKVYIHCSTAVCSAAPGRSCEPSCFTKHRKRRDVGAVDQKKLEPKVVVSVGPVIMGTPEEE